MILLTDGQVDVETGRVDRGGVVSQLTPTEASLLGFLAVQDGPTSRSELLQEVWGYHPDVESRTVFNAIRRLRLKVEVDPANPRHVLTVRGRGYRFVGPQPGVQPPKVPSDAFFGRAQELAWLREHRRQPGLVTVVGLGGIGKTRLVLEGRGEGPGWFCDLSAARSERDVVALVSAVLGTEPGRVPAALRGAAADNDASTPVLILDNAEQVVGPLALLVDRWRRAAPGVCIVVTSRIRLGLSGERTLELAPLDSTTGSALLRDRLPDGRSLDPGLAERLVAGLDGLPLALEMAAVRLRVLSGEAILRRAASLGHDRRDRPARQATLAAVFDSSWELLEPAEQRALSRLSVFRSSFSLMAVAALLPGDTDAVSSLEALVAHSLVRVIDDGEEPRFRVPETLRILAAARLAAAPGEPGLTHQRLARWALERAEALAAQVVGPNGIDARRALNQERENLLAAKPLLHGDARARLVLALDPVLATGWPLSDRLAILDEAVAEATERPTRSRALRARAFTRVAAGRSADALSDARAAADLADEVLDRILAEREQAGALYTMGRSAAGVALYQQLLAELDDLGETGVAASIRGRLGGLHLAAGDGVRALPLLDKAIAGHRAVGHDLNEANCLRKRVMARAHPVVLEDDLGDLRRAISLASGADAPGFVASTEVLLAWLQYRRRDLAAASGTIGAAIGVQLRLGQPVREANALLHRGIIEHDRGNPVEARSAHRRGLDLCLQSGHAEGQAWTLAQLALLDALAHRPDEARAGFDRAEALFGGDPSGMAVLSVQRAVLLARLGDRSAAHAALAAADQRIRVIHGWFHAVGWLRRELEVVPDHG